MKTILATLTCCAMLLMTAACASGVSAASGASDAPEETAASVSASVERGVENRPGAPEQNSVVGKIVSLSDSDITVELASMDRPEGMPERGEAPGGKRPEEMPESPEIPEEDGERPEPPANEPGASGRPEGGGRRGGAGMALTYTGETATYALLETCTVHSGMGENAETLALSDLAEGEVVRLALDDDEAVSAISRMPQERPDNWVSMDENTENAE